MRWLWEKINPSSQPPSQWDHFQQKRLDKMAAEAEERQGRQAYLLQSQAFRRWADNLPSLLPAAELEWAAREFSQGEMKIDHKDLVAALKAIKGQQ